MIPRLLILCNAFDDKTRIERGVTTDSPAGSRKVFQLAQALKKGGVSPWVLSLGRGRAGGEKRFFSGHVRRVEGIPVIYAPFSTVPWVSELVSLFAFVPIVLRLRKFRIRGALFYNRMIAYLPVLIACFLLGYQRFLDLEDGEILKTGSRLRRAVRSALSRVFDRLCSGGALLACSALSKWTDIRPTLCYYGTAVGDLSSKRFCSERFTILMGGALLPETGADLLADAIEHLRRAKPSWADLLQFEITGQGESLERFRRLEEDQGHTGPWVKVHGRVTDIGYREILSRCDVGLALKLNAGELAHTTFPSKVIEYASAGLLVLTTDISDVRTVLGNQGAVFLQRDDPDLLNSLFFDLIMNRPQARLIAENGFLRTHEQCDPVTAGLAVSRFLFEGKP